MSQLAARALPAWQADPLPKTPPLPLGLLIHPTPQE